MQGPQTLLLGPTLQVQRAVTPVMSELAPSAPLHPLWKDGDH